MHWQSPWLRGFLVLLLIGGIGAGSVTWREYQRGQRIESEIDTLRTEANKVRMENDGLSQKIRYFDSPDFQEREAKEKLGFRRQEEEVVLLPESLPVSPDEKTENASAEKPRFEANRPNYEKWWKLFFPVN